MYLLKTGRFFHLQNLIRFDMSSLLGERKEKRQYYRTKKT